jgi:hypothetical protein
MYNGVTIGPIGRRSGISNSETTLLWADSGGSQKLVGVATGTRLGDSILERVLFIVDAGTSPTAAPYPFANTKKPMDWGSRAPVFLETIQLEGPTRLDALLRARVGRLQSRLFVVERTFLWHKSDSVAPVSDWVEGRRANYAPPPGVPDAARGSGAAVWQSSHHKRFVVGVIPKNAPAGFLNGWSVQETQIAQKFGAWKAAAFDPTVADLWTCTWAGSPQAFRI